MNNIEIVKIKKIDLIKIILYHLYKIFCYCDGFFAFVLDNLIGYLDFNQTNDLETWLNQANNMQFYFIEILKRQFLEVIGMKFSIIVGVLVKLVLVEGNFIK